MMKSANVTALIWVSLQPCTSSKKGPHLLFCMGYFFIQFNNTSKAFLYFEAFFASSVCRSRKSSIVLHQLEVYSALPTTVPSVLLFLRSPVSPVNAFTLKGNGE